MCVWVKFRRNGENTRRKHTIHVTEWQVRRAAVRQMSKMLRLELVGIVLLACTQILTEHRDFYGPFNQYGHQRSGHRRQWEDDGMTKEVRVKEGLLRGMVKRPATHQRLQLVDVFLGVPYAEPPVGFLRFSPPRSPQPWRHVRKAEEFAPVCPQLLPNLRLEVEPGRHEFLERLLPYLRNQSEDCLYLNIYAPHQECIITKSTIGNKEFTAALPGILSSLVGKEVQLQYSACEREIRGIEKKNFSETETFQCLDGPGNPRRYPVMVFIQGESFEWNSGNPYDGTVISAYGNIVFVTINFRLGILGFLRPGTSSDVASNFGLLDQTAALVWLRDNIAFFGGDPDSMTLVGHGTGAIFANLLLISPVANNKGLFRRAILMSGSALSSDAIGKAPLQITKQVAHALNCPTKSDNDLALCLRNRDLDVLLNVKIAKPRYVPAYAPLIDRAVLPRKPLALMQNAQLFGSFDLMYGVTESEKYHLLSPIDALHGMLDQERDNVLRDYAKATHELEPELALTKILDHYGDFREGYTGEYTIKNRDLVLDALSDSGTVAPLMMVADMHSRANPKSYMYVFTHPKATKDYTQQQPQRTVHGEEIPYILGIPLDAGRYHFMSDRYSIGEKLFSEAMMTWWCNFAHTGNPNAPRRLAYMTDGPREWMQYQVDWPEYSPSNRTYFNLTIPPNVDLNYRANAMQFWNNDLPNVIRHRPTAPRPIILDYADGMGNFSMESMPGLMPASTTIVHDSDNSVPSPTGKTLVNDVRSSTSIKENASMRGLSAITLMVGFGVVFLLINVTAFLYLYHRRHSLKRTEKKSRSGAPNEADNNSTKRTRATKPKNNQLADNVEIGQKSISTPDINEVIKHDKAYDNNSNFGRRSKLSRQNSSSTIDTHIKVKEWIQQEIVHRCSPRFLRKTRETLRKEHQERLTTQQQIEEDEERKRCHEEKRREDSAAPTYEHSPALVVRPGKKTKAPKVSVAVDATPATRTESILNQIPIELVKNMEMINDLAALESDATPPKPRVVVVEHHHSRSDPLPMEDVYKCANPNFSTTRMYESDSESASSLYAKTNSNLKTWLQRAGQAMAPEDKSADKSHLILEAPDDDIYALGIGKLTTFGLKEQTGDVNVTCQEPVADRQVISPEEALKTIKRRNYPKVLPDIEKRRSLPAPNSLYVPKVYGTLSKEHRHGARNAAEIGQPPPPPPRIFGTSKSLDLAEEIEDREPITTNLHVGPLLKRQDSGTGNIADLNLIDSLERVATDAQKVLSNHQIEYSNTLGSGGITTNLKCPLHGDGFAFDQVITDTNTSQSVDCLDRNLGNPNWYRNKEPSAVGTKAPANSSLPNIIGNPNWYKPVATSRDIEERQFTGALSKNNFYAERSNLLNEIKTPGEPKIIITPRVGNLLGQSRQNLSPAASCLTTHKDVHEEPRIVFIPKTEMVDRIYSVDKEKSNDRHQAPSSPIESEPKSIATVANQSQVASPLNAMKEERNEPRIIITPKDTKNPVIGPNTKQPKIIIKPTNLPTKNREQRNIPKITAIPSPVSQTVLNFENDTKGPEQPHETILRLEKPPLRDKPMVTRIPSFSRRKDGRPDYNEKPIDQYDKNDAAQRVHAITTIFSNSEKNSTPFLLEKELDSPASATNSSNSNTNTIKRKPPNKK